MVLTYIRHIPSLRPTTQLFLALKMSSDPFGSPSEAAGEYPGSLIDVVSQMFCVNYLEVASLTILFYDFLLTLGTESKRFWERPGWSTAAVLFYLNRYGVMSGYIAITYFFFSPDFLVSTKVRCLQLAPFRLLTSHTRQSCLKFEVFIQLHVAYTHVIIGCILILRTSALYNGDRRVKYGLSSLIVIMSINGGVQWYLSTFAGPQGPSVNQTIVKNSPFHPGCYIPYGHLQGVEIASEWALLLIFDAAVFFLTIRKTLPLVRNDRSGNSNLWVSLLRDGSIYFGLLSISNVANIFVLLSSPPYMKPLFPIFVNTLSSTAISRLMMNLRDPFLRNPQRLPTKAAPVAEALPVVEIVRTTRKDDLEAGSPSAPKNPRAVDITDAIRSFLLATPPRPPIQAAFHQPAWRVNTVGGSDQATIMA
ncbi:hypothetical protein AB1N83_002723 [Pleurotus pulmonarius]